MGDVTRASVPAASQATALRSEAARRGLALPVEFDVPDHTGRGSGSISSRRAAGTAAGVSCSRIRSMATYVLVHGAWHGGWCWRAVARSLRADGHEVHAPSLTGLGDRRHLAAPDIDLDTHVMDVVHLLEMEDLTGVVLVGHSYGGMVVTGAADRAHPRIRSLVYLDAFVPEDGRTLLDYVVPERAARMAEEGRRTGWVSPPPMSLWGLREREHLDFVGAARGEAAVRDDDQQDRARQPGRARPAAEDVRLLLVARHRLLRPVRRPVSRRARLAVPRAEDRARRDDPGPRRGHRDPAVRGRPGLSGGAAAPSMPRGHAGRRQP